MRAGRPGAADAGRPHGARACRSRERGRPRPETPGTLPRSRREQCSGRHRPPGGRTPAHSARTCALAPPRRRCPGHDLCHRKPRQRVAGCRGPAPIAERARRRDSEESRQRRGGASAEVRAQRARPGRSTPARVSRRSRWNTHRCRASPLSRGTILDLAPPRKHDTDHILDAARALVLRDGPRSTSVAAIP